MRSADVDSIVRLVSHMMAKNTRHKVKCEINRIIECDREINKREMAERPLDYFTFSIQILIAIEYRRFDSNRTDSIELHTLHAIRLWISHIVRVHIDNAHD